MRFHGVLGCRDYRNKGYKINLKAPNPRCRSDDMEPCSFQKNSAQEARQRADRAPPDGTLPAELSTLRRSDPFLSPTPSSLKANLPLPPKSRSQSPRHPPTLNPNPVSTRTFGHGDGGTSGARVASRMRWGLDRRLVDLIAFAPAGTRKVTGMSSPVNMPTVLPFDLRGLL